MGGRWVTWVKVFKSYQLSVRKINVIINSDEIDKEDALGNIMISRLDI